MDSELNRTMQWAVLIGLSAALSALLVWLAIPAALLLGPIVAGILVTTNGGQVDVPNRPFVLAQGLIGCMVAKMLPLSIAGEMLGRWPVFAFGALSVIVASALLGLLLSRMKVLPGSTALWGLSPGGATTMVVMAEAYGADAQLVALMQYLRVVVVAAVASIVARLWGVNVSHAAAQANAWFPPVAWIPLAETIALAVLGAVIGNLLRLQAGALLLPLVAGIVLTRFGLMTIELPRWLLTVTYAVIGWRIGLRFTRPLLIYAAKALPRVMLCTLVLVVFCAVLGALLVVFVGIDPLTAYLATSPGGADSVAIIAAASKVDASFVMAMQMARMIAVLVLGPPMARFVATHADL
jgi:membrane AbrB-like protein